jgi:hypothetical protein
VDQEYDALKFKELVLHVALRSASDERFGQVKLNKILFYADFLAYAHFGEAITGARYQKGQWGPIAVPLVPVLDELLLHRDAAVVPRGYYGREQRVVVAARQPDLDRFRAREIALVDDVIDALRGKDASEVSELSHTLVGWKLAELGEDIPYETVFLEDRDPTPEEIERGLELAERFGWP